MSKPNLKHEPKLTPDTNTESNQQPQNKETNFNFPINESRVHKLTQDTNTESNQQP